MNESDTDNLQEILNAPKVADIACVERQVSSHSGGRDQQINGSGATRLASDRGNCRVDASIRPGAVGTERQRIKCGLGPLKPILPSCPLAAVARRVRAGCQLGHGKGANRKLTGKTFRVDVL
jgi:hypothetical protein